jgi:predicted GTPase
MTLEEAIKHTKDIAKDVSECTDCRMEHKQLTGWLEELLAYRKMDKHGRLLRLPCRPNDIVYRINKAARVPIIKMAVKRIVLFDKSYALEVVDEYGGQLLFLADDIGKVLYITREEAEAKLKEMEEKS